MKGDIFAYLILSSSSYFLRHIRALITVWPSSGNDQVEITPDNLVNSLNGALLTLEIGGALTFERTQSSNIIEETKCTFLLARIESIDIAIVQPSDHSSTLELLFEQHPFFSIYTVGVQVALSLRDPNGQVTLQAESCHSSLNTHIQQVMRQVMDAAMPPHIQLIRSVCQKHYSKANGNEQQVCFFNVGPPLTPEKVRKAAARIVRKSVDDQDIAISLNSTLYETGVSELFTSISLRRNGNLAYTQEPWNVNMVHAWSKSDKTISLCKHLIQVGLVRVVLRLDPLLYRNIIPAMVSPASPIISRGQLQPIAGRIPTFSAIAKVSLVGQGNLNRIGS
uniref:AlNc14C207G8832 protein n=1 Tax=Albugo laibachii Nc14 TaxID=890382 RepID=F0WR24_9STRA|nr:AlNc14C207G8832 [Albugo laibachii Nc14]|eukprot:CCA23784.1 AlNc14C207G8832 [Albugo laibachii Nc14]